ncbi:Histidine kinase-, DNA gyrase B-, and HSP90-like ATPase [Lutibacter agarilyticus]|uniref:histidine kinase n=1 Tax=Lutibacter agarilyticus TaxID=1109740 RepID=A0A238VVF8_9FLAO|nr:HAMP domain-containing sensor histidine kinase [Lutibacter agarilyticus]SNR38117.1 Histidine kinase-, DNA gyrase B-, and HSP90-like ATPase [Lutibacter agarilyticus]
MKENKKDLASYIDELESKLVDLSLKLKAKDTELKTVQTENFNRIRKVVHNLKNPIGVAYSFAEILATIDCVSANEKSKKYVEIIKNSNDFSIQFLTSLSKLNRLKSPDYKLIKASTNYIKLVSIAVDEFAYEAKDKNRLILNKTSGNELFLNIDSPEIEFLIRILIRNAVRFSSKETTITVEVIEQNDCIETIIKDQGIGISATDLKTIFNEFFVVNTYDVANEKCIGLGLTIAKIILEKHHGTIDVKSTLNSGTEVKISIPKK